MRGTSWVVAVRLVLGALAFCGAWLWLGEGNGSSARSCSSSPWRVSGPWAARSGRAD